MVVSMVRLVLSALIGLLAVHLASAQQVWQPGPYPPDIFKIFTNQSRWANQRSIYARWEITKSGGNSYPGFTYLMEETFDWSYPRKNGQLDWYNFIPDQNNPQLKSNGTFIYLNSTETFLLQKGQCLLGNVLKLTTTNVPPSPWNAVLKTHLSEYWTGLPVTGNNIGGGMEVLGPSVFFRNLSMYLAPSNPYNFGPVKMTRWDQIPADQRLWPFPYYSWTTSNQNGKTYTWYFTDATFNSFGQYPVPLRVEINAGASGYQLFISAEQFWPRPYGSRISVPLGLGCGRDTSTFYNTYGSMPIPPRIDDKSYSMSMEVVMGPFYSRGFYQPKYIVDDGYLVYFTGGRKMQIYSWEYDGFNNDMVDPIIPTTPRPRLFNEKVEKSPRTKREASGSFASSSPVGIDGEEWGHAGFEHGHEVDPKYEKTRLVAGGRFGGEVIKRNKKVNKKIKVEAIQAKDMVMDVDDDDDDMMGAEQTIWDISTDYLYQLIDGEDSASDRSCMASYPSFVSNKDGYLSIIFKNGYQIGVNNLTKFTDMQNFKWMGWRYLRGVPVNVYERKYDQMKVGIKPIKGTWQPIYKPVVMTHYYYFGDYYESENVPLNSTLLKIGVSILDSTANTTKVWNATINVNGFLRKMKSQDLQSIFDVSNCHTEADQYKWFQISFPLSNLNYLRLVGMQNSIMNQLLYYMYYAQQIPPYRVPRLLVDFDKPVLLVTGKFVQRMGFDHDFDYKFFSPNFGNSGGSDKVITPPMNDQVTKVVQTADECAFSCINDGCSVFSICSQFQCIYSRSDDYQLGGNFNNVKWRATTPPGRCTTFKRKPTTPAKTMDDLIATLGDLTKPAMTKCYPYRFDDSDSGSWDPTDPDSDPSFGVGGNRFCVSQRQVNGSYDKIKMLATKIVSGFKFVNKDFHSDKSQVQPETSRYSTSYPTLKFQLSNEVIGSILNGVGRYNKMMRLVPGVTSFRQCEVRCDNELLDNCFSFSYCFSSQECIITNFTDTELLFGRYQNATAFNTDCIIYTRNFLSEYRAAGGFSAYVVPKFASKTGKTMIEDECARNCTTSTTDDTGKPFKCRSFEWCTGMGRDKPNCFLHVGHYLDSNKIKEPIPVNNGSKWAACTHYSRNFVGDFKSIANSQFADTNNKQTRTNVNIEQCARECVESAGRSCVSFSFCKNPQINNPKNVTTRCMMASKANTPMKNGQPNVVNNTRCAVYVVQTSGQLLRPDNNNDGRVNNRTNRSAGTAGYSAGLGVGVGVLMLVVGAGIGLLGALVFQRREEVRERFFGAR